MISNRPISQIIKRFRALSEINWAFFRHNLIFPSPDSFIYRIRILSGNRIIWEIVEPIEEIRYQQDFNLAGFKRNWPA